MTELNNYKTGLLHLVRLLTAAPLFVSIDKIENLFLGEGIDKAWVENLDLDFEKMNESEIFNQGTRLISNCSDEHKVRTFIFLFRLSQINKKIRRREIQLLQYACRLNTAQVLHVKLQLDEQKAAPIQTHHVIFIVGGSEIDVFILEKLMMGYLANIVIEFHSNIATAFAKMIDRVHKPKIIIVDVDPLRFTEHTLLDQFVRSSAGMSVYLLTLSKYLLGKTLKLSNATRIKGVFEKPLVAADIQQLATENRLQFSSPVFEVRK